MIFLCLVVEKLLLETVPDSGEELNLEFGSVFSVNHEVLVFFPKFFSLLFELELKLGDTALKLNIFEFYGNFCLLGLFVQG